MSDIRHGPFCRKLMRHNRELCGRRAGHGGTCRSRTAVANANEAAKFRYLAAHVAPLVRVVVLGPVPCQGCGAMVSYTTGRMRAAHARAWRNADLSAHVCASNARAISLASERDSSYDSLAGSSSESASIATVARASATTRSAGNVASIEVVAR